MPVGNPSDALLKENDVKFVECVDKLVAKGGPMIKAPLTARTRKRLKSNQKRDH